MNECIKFAENKRIINDRIDKWLNEKEFHRMTLNSGYDGIIFFAQKLVSAFFDPNINDEIRSDSKIWSSYLTRDAREQAYRICDYVLNYMESYAKNGSLIGETRKGLMDVLREKWNEVKI